MKKLSDFNRIKLLPMVTPIQPLTRLSDYLGGPQIYVKRDDLNFIGEGGNKLRKLEFHIGEAKARGANVIIATGALQSNLARVTAAVALSQGFGCELILKSKVRRYDDDYQYNGNVLLDKILDVRTYNVSSDADMLKTVRRLEDKLRDAGKKPYIIPFGASDALGSLGYVSCANEIADQMREMDLRFDYVVLPNGSSGTHAGLLAGFKALDVDIDIKGYSVLDNDSVTADNTLELARDTLKLLDSRAKIGSSDVLVDDRCLGDGYGIPTRRMIETVRLVAEKEGLFLDPVYGGKAFAGLIGGIKMGKYRRNQKILYLMTGGVPGLYAYRKEFYSGSH
ncbi:MAG: D-cysteine desulfhydrase family protein [Neisseriales bacterium]|nr:MAG: D-cysteine desulfhydrase family protein [Neisseriales bacterium]